MMRITIQYFGGRGGAGSGGARGGRAGGGVGSQKSPTISRNGVTLDLGESQAPESWSWSSRVESALRTNNLSVEADSINDAVKKFNLACKNPDGEGWKMVRADGASFTVKETWKNRATGTQYVDVMPWPQPNGKYKFVG